LKLNKFEFAKWLKDTLEVTLIDTEMDVTHIQPVKGSSVFVATAGLGAARLAVFLGFSQLSDDGNS
jgi:hypothetical protein